MRLLFRASHVARNDGMSGHHPTVQVRPYINMSLRERMHARPFLTVIEKKWLAYQLLNALNQVPEVSPQP
jgi:hypothetical protein